MNFLLSDVPLPIVNYDDKTTPYIFGNIRWYGFLIAIGFVIGIICIMIKLMKFYRLNTDPFYYYCLMVIPWSIFCGMFWSACIGDRKWSSFFDFTHGGLAIQGAVFGAVLLGIIYFPLVLKRPKFQVRDTFGEKPVIRRVSTWVYADAIVPALLIGQVIGRWGNYMNQEVYGSVVTNHSFQVWLSTHLPYMYINGNYYQPLFLYESCANIVGFILIFIVLEFTPKIKAGTIACSYFLWYGILRIIFEPLRYHDESKTFTFLGTYIMDSLWITFSLALIVLNQTGIIPSLRKHRIYIRMKDSIFTNGITFSLLKSKMQNLVNKQKRNSKDLGKAKKQLLLIKDNQNKEALIVKINKLEQQANQNDINLVETKKQLELNRKQHENNKKLFIRTNEALLYYLGR
ncbi:MAG: prolipoprotein diacylglyceryl transferase [Mycoplasma sp.]